MLYRRDIRNDCRRLWTGRWTEMAPDTEIRPELVTFAIVSPQKHGSWNPHRHIGYELIIPVQGTVYECHVNSRKIKLHSGEALFNQVIIRQKHIFRLPAAQGQIICRPAPYPRPLL